MAENKNAPEVTQNSRLPVGRFVLDGQKTGVWLTERTGLYITQLSFFQAQQKPLGTLLKRRFSLASLPAPLLGTAGRDVMAVRVEAGKIWMLSDRALVPDLTPAFAGYYPLDLSASRVALQIAGEQAASLINRMAALDLSCPAGTVMATGMHHVPVLVIKQETADYLLLMPRSYAESLAHSLFETARQFGLTVRRPASWALKEQK